MPISSANLDFLWQQAKNLKSYHELLRYVDNLPDSKSKERLKQNVEELLNDNEGTGMSTISVPVANVPSFETTYVNPISTTKDNDKSFTWKNVGSNDMCPTISLSISSTGLFANLIRLV
jgi:hypothetical protein